MNLERVQRIILLLVFCSVSIMAGHAQSLFEKEINLKIKDESLHEALWILSEQLEVPISFIDRDIENKMIDVDFDQATLHTILITFFQGTSNYYEYKNGQLYILLDNGKEKILSGYIEDANTGERLIGASISNVPSFSGSVSNNFGFFSLESKLYDSIAIVSYIGYEDQEINLRGTDNDAIVIGLVASNKLPEIVIQARENDESNRQESILSSDVKRDFELSHVPSVGGSKDILRLLDQMPGATTGTDGVGGLFVRGGNPDQNLIMLDGVQIYNPYHTFGLFSIFDKNTMSSVDYHKGSFPARFGGRLSSVLDVRLKDGNSKDFNFNFSTGLISSRVMIEGPIIKDKLSFMINARRSHLDPIINGESFREALLGEATDKLDYSFSDIVAKMTYSLSKRDRIYLSYYGGSDNFEKIVVGKLINEKTTKELEDVNQKLDWGNNLAVLRWNHQFGKKLFSNFTTTYSKFNFNSDEQSLLQYRLIPNSALFDTISESSVYESDIQRFSGKFEIEFIPNSKHYFRTGLTYSQNGFRPGVSLTEGEENPFVGQLREAKEYNFYIEDEWKVSDNLTAGFGMFNSLFSIEESNYYSFEPRASIRWKMTDRFSLLSSYSKNSQNLHVLSRSGSGFPTDLWVPSTSKVKPEIASIIDFNLNYEIKGGIEVNVGAYTKKMENLVSYTEEFDFNNLVESSLLNSFNWEDNVVSGSGTAKGLEFLVKKSNRNWTGWISYSLSDINRNFSSINEGKDYPFRFEHQNKLHINFQYVVSQKWKFGTSWSYNSGSFTNIPLSKWQYVRQNGFEDWFYYDLGDKNSYQLPAYHRLDISVSYAEEKDWGVWSIDFGVYNAYNRRNIFYIASQYFPNSVDVNFSSVSIIPILPYVSFEITL